MYGANHRGQHPAYEPGIEVVQAEYHPDAAVPQVSLDPSQNDKYALVSTVQEQGEGTHWFKNEEPQSHAHAHADTPRSTWKRKRWIVLAVGAIIVIIVAATVGGVVGTRSRQSADGARDEAPEKTSTESPPDNPREMTGSPTSVAPGLAPTAVSVNSSHLEVWALTKDTTNSVYRKWLNDSSPDGVEPQGTDMELVGGGIPVDATKTPSIAIVKRARERFKGGYRLDVQVTSTREPGAFWTWLYADNIIRPSYPNKPWGEWTAASSLSSAPVLVVYGDEVDKITAVFLKDDFIAGATVWYAHAEVKTKWDIVEPLSGGPNLHPWATPAALAWDPKSPRVDIFAVSTDNHLQHAILEDPQKRRRSEYEDLGGFVTTPPTVVAREPGSLDVFVRGGDGGLWHLSLEDEKTWSSWRCISGNTSIQGQPHAISASRNSIDVFAWGDGDGAMLYKTYDAVARKWTPNGDEFIPLGISGLVGPPKGVVFGDDVVVLAYDEDNNIVWQTIGSNKTAVGEPRILAKVPAKVS